jgi:hypothetical protein
LDYRRIEQSDTWALAPPELRPWLLMLWYRAWQQIPAGAFVDDDEIIAARIGMPLPMFQLHRPVLMRGWTRREDGRLYHPVIVSKVIERVEWRRAEAERKRAYREKMSQGTDKGQTRDSTVRPDTGAGAGAGAGASSKSKTTPTRAEAKNLRGTRMTRDFTPPDRWLDWACTVFKIDRQRAMREFIEFRDYWADIPGNRGLKIEWEPTFRNRLRTRRENGKL